MNKTTYKTTVLKVAVHPEGESPLLDESATHVSLVDEGGGPFVEIRQNGAHMEVGAILLDFAEIKPVFAACRALIAGVKE